MTEKPSPKREKKTHSFNPVIYKAYQTLLESRGHVPASRDLERHMMRQINNI